MRLVYVCTATMAPGDEASRCAPVGARIKFLQHSAAPAIPPVICVTTVNIQYSDHYMHSVHNLHKSTSTQYAPKFLAAVQVLETIFTYLFCNSYMLADLVHLLYTPLLRVVYMLLSKLHSQNRYIEHVMPHSTLIFIGIYTVT